MARAIRTITVAFQRARSSHIRQDTSLRRLNRGNTCVFPPKKASRICCSSWRPRSRPASSPSPPGASRSNAASAKILFTERCVSQKDTFGIISKSSRSNAASKGTLKICFKLRFQSRFKILSRFVPRYLVKIPFKTHIEIRFKMPFKIPLKILSKICNDTGSRTATGSTAAPSPRNAGVPSKKSVGLLRLGETYVSRRRHDASHAQSASHARVRNAVRRPVGPGHGRERRGTLSLSLSLSLGTQTNLLTRETLRFSRARLNRKHWVFFPSQSGCGITRPQVAAHRDERASAARLTARPRVFSRARVPFPQKKKKKEEQKEGKREYFSLARHVALRRPKRANREKYEEKETKKKKKTELRRARGRRCVAHDVVSMFAFVSRSKLTRMSLEVASLVSTVSPMIRGENHASVVERSPAAFERTLRVRNSHRASHACLRVKSIHVSTVFRCRLGFRGALNADAEGRGGPRIVILLSFLFPVRIVPRLRRKGSPLQDAKRLGQHALSRNVALSLPRLERLSRPSLLFERVSCNVSFARRSSDNAPARWAAGGACVAATALIATGIPQLGLGRRRCVDFSF